MAAALYTPDVLGLATGLAAWPWDDALPLRGSARSRSCGSTLMLGLATDGDGRIVRIGVQAQACAIGQASVAIFAGAATGRDGVAIGAAHQAIETWLTQGGALPDWPGIARIAAARDYPGRHGAILLGWQAARDLLCTAAVRV